MSFDTLNDARIQRLHMWSEVGKEWLKVDVGWLIINLVAREVVQ